MGLPSHHHVGSVMGQRSHHLQGELMHVFVTGGTGTIGSAVVAELLGNGHTVLALARSDGSAQALDRAGAKVLRGDLADLHALRSGAAQCDGVISLAFGRDYGSPDALAQAIAEESAALATLGQELIGSDRPIVTVSGTPWVPGRASTEADPLPTDGPVGGRGRSVNALLDLASRGVRSMAVRMPRTVHNEGKGGFAGLLTDQARRTGVALPPGRRHPALAYRARARRSRPVPAGPRVRTGRDGLARRRRRGRRGAGHRHSHRPATGPAGRGGSAGELRPVRPDLRHGPARRPAPTPAMPSGGSRPTPASSRTWRPFSPDAHRFDGTVRGRLDGLPTRGRYARCRDSRSCRG